MWRRKRARGQLRLAPVWRMRGVRRVCGVCDACVACVRFAACVCAARVCGM